MRSRTSFCSRPLFYRRASSQPSGTRARGGGSGVLPRKAHTLPGLHSRRAGPSAHWPAFSALARPWSRARRCRREKSDTLAGYEGDGSVRQLRTLMVAAFLSAAGAALAGEGGVVTLSLNDADLVPDEWTRMAQAGMPNEATHPTV